MSKTLIHGGTLISDDHTRKGWIIINGDRIEQVGEGDFTGDFSGNRINAKGKIVMPGVIDDHVHFREPGLDYKGSINSESRAAVAGGVTSFMDMPNTKPEVVNRAALEEKFEIASVSSLANYSFYFGATNDNLKEIKTVDPKMVCGVKLFLGSSTGNMLVDNEYALSAIFSESPVLVAIHCEDERIIRENSEKYKAKYAADIKPEMHQLIRSAEACYRSSAFAVGLADKYDANIHILHLTTARELSLFDKKPLSHKKITAEACVHHLWFSDEDYAAKGNLIKINPAIKTLADQHSLREGLTNGKIDIVGTDHAPHTFIEKKSSYWECPSGMPAIQHSLVTLLELTMHGVLTVEQVVNKMCHAPAVRFGIKERGFLREGYYADIAIIESASSWVVSKENILYKCGWSPLEGTEFTHKITHTIINGKVVFDHGNFDESFRGVPLEFNRQ